MPVLGYNLVLAVLTAVTVVVSMRVVGLLLISALMILPNATAQLLARSFRASMWWAVVIGVACSVGGVVVVLLGRDPVGRHDRAARHRGVPRRERRRGRRRGRACAGRPTPARSGTTTSTARDCGHPALEHGDHVDYLHDGHRHAAHEGHYDEHGEHAEVETR